MDCILRLRAAGGDSYGHARASHDLGQDRWHLAIDHVNTVDETFAFLYRQELLREIVCVD